MDEYLKFDSVSASLSFELVSQRKNDEILKFTYSFLFFDKI